MDCPRSTAGCNNHDGFRNHACIGMEAMSSQNGSLRRCGLCLPGHRTPQVIMDEIAALDAESAEVLARIRGLV